ncbi:MAG: hypothetical protein AB1427_11875 [Thermodesulfobacteriota bacterium]
MKKDPTKQLAIQGVERMLVLSAALAEYVSMGKSNFSNNTWVSDFSDY